MDKNITKVYDYDKLSIDVLSHLLIHVRQADKEKKKLVLKTIVKKYFEDKSCFNLYSFLISGNSSFLNKNEFISFNVEIIGREFSDKLEIPEDFRESFFSFLISTMSMLEYEIKLNNGKIEWDLINITKLISYLEDVDNLNISSPSLRQQINDLINKIKEEYQRKLEQAKTDTISPVIVNNKIEKLKTLKLQKSKLTKKNNLEDALTSFKLYNNEDKKYLIDFVIKHSWQNMLMNANLIDMFDYFKTNPNTLEFFSMWRFLYIGLTKGQFKGEHQDIKAWKRYFEVDSFSELMNSIKSLYLSYENSTELGFKVYENKILNDIGETHIFDASDEITEYIRNNYKEDMLNDIGQFIWFKNKTLMEMCSDHNFSNGYILKSFPIINPDNKKMIEAIEKNTIKIMPIIHYWNIYNKYNQLFYSYFGNTTRQKELLYAFSDEDFNDAVNEFIYLPDTIKFDGDMLTEIYNSSFKNNADLSIRNFLRRYFSQNDDKISDELIKNIWFNEKNRHAFFDFVSYTSYSGSYMKPEEYSSFFFKRLNNELDFSNIDNLKLFLSLPLSYSENETMNIFMKKIEYECVDFYLLVSDYLGEFINSSYSEVIKLLKKYYKID